MQLTGSEWIAHKSQPRIKTAAYQNEEREKIRDSLIANKIDYTFRKEILREQGPLGNYSWAKLNPLSHSLVDQDKCDLVEAPRTKNIPSAAPNCAYEGLIKLREKKLDRALEEIPKADHLIW